MKIKNILIYKENKQKFYNDLKEINNSINNIFKKIIEKNNIIYVYIHIDKLFRHLIDIECELEVMNSYDPEYKKLISMRHKLKYYLYNSSM